MRLTVDKPQDITDRAAIRVTLEITTADYLAARLDPWDRMTLDSCEDGGTIADALLGFELLARRIQEGQRQGAAPAKD